MKSKLNLSILVPGIGLLIIGLLDPSTHAYFYIGLGILLILGSGYNFFLPGK